MGWFCSRRNGKVGYRMQWRANSIDDDDDAAIASIPSQRPGQIGNGATQQTIVTGDDRSMGGDYHTGILTGDILQSPKTEVWYDTLRPNAGFPLPIMADNQYGDKVADGVNDLSPTIMDSTYRVPEREQPTLTRFSSHPSSVQEPIPWDTTLGAWPWTGDKAALQRPVASTPELIDVPSNGTPYPGGNASEISNTPSYEPMPLTFRAPPEPWATGRDGYYVDSGE